MKKCYLIAALLTAIALLASCERSLQKDTAESPLDDCRAVLESNSMMYDTETNEKTYIHDYIQKKELSVSKYSETDLNGDGISELVLWLARGNYAYYGFLILHYGDGTVYAYELTYRAFYALKEDGTFSYSSGASDHGIGKINFANGTYSIDRIAYCESGSDTQKVSYYIGNSDVSMEDFETYMTAQSNKQSAVWQEYTTDAS